MIYNKKYVYKYSSGTESLVVALKQLNSKRVIVPSYTCTDLITAIQIAGCEFFIADCDFNLQISLKSVTNLIKKFDIDTIIIPHMFGIQAPISEIRTSFSSLKIIEDCSQGHGLPNIGEFSDVIVSSINTGKWLTSNIHYGLLYTNNEITLQSNVTHEMYIKELHASITNKVKNRKERAREIQNAGVVLIAYDEPNVFLRGMYYTDKQKRIPYIPLHDIYDPYKKFNCPQVDDFKTKIDWISIYG